MRCVAMLLLTLLTNSLWADAPIRVAVAANFKPTLEKISLQFQAQTGIEVSLSSASTGVLFSQIKYGAPFNLFFAADQQAPEALVASGQADADSTFCYALGSLVLSGGDGSLSQLANPGLSLAIANPVTAPYGSAAMEVLARKEFAPGNTRKLVRGNNVVQTYQFWHSGAVDLALLPRAIAPESAIRVPQQWHQPLEQHAVVLIRNTAVDAYLNWIRSDTVRSLITQAGYEPCP
jgi:molybdate transport system substrate-binding protein